MSEGLSFKVGEGRTEVAYSLTWQGMDVYISVEGGESHIGSVAVVVKGRISIITVPGHRDDLLARPIAEAVSGIFQGTVVVMAGVHWDNITKEEIKTVLSNNTRAATTMKTYLMAGHSDQTH